MLKVFFMNPEVLEGWKCEGKKKLTTDKIMEWAGVWNSDKAPSVPQFTVTQRVDKADVRVKFSGNSNLELLQISMVLPTQPMTNALLRWVCRQLPFLKISQQ